MANKVLSQDVHMVPLLDPVADALSGTVTTSPINCRDVQAVTFYIYWGVGATGTTTLTVEACDNTTPSNTSAIKFRSRVRTATDVFSAITERGTTGFTTTAGSSQVYVIEVDTDEMGNSGYGYVRLKAVESTDSPILATIFAMVKVAKSRAITSTVVT